MFKSRFYLPDDLAALARSNYTAGRTFSCAQDCTAHERALILPLRPLVQSTCMGGVCNERHELLAGYRSHERLLLGYGLDIVRGYRPSRVRRMHETVIFGGVLASHFGHTITDSMTRLWYVVRHRPEHRVAFVFKKFSGDGLCPYHHELLQLLGLPPERVLVVDEPMQFDCVLVPPQACFWGSGHDPERFALPYDAIRSRITPGAGRRLYLSKSQVSSVPHSSDTEVFGERYFEDFFAARGFEILHPEQLPLTGQLSALAGAEVIVSTAGTLSHMAVFAKPGIRLIILVRAHNRPHLAYWYQHVINRARRLDFCFVDVAANLLPCQSACLIGPTEHWDRFAHDEYAAGHGPGLLEFMDEHPVQLGSYIRACLRHTRGGMRPGDLIEHQQSLMRTFNPGFYARQLYDQPPARRFAGRTFLLRAAAGLRGGLSGEGLVLEFRADGTVRICRPADQANGFYWICLKNSLYLLNAFHNTEFAFSTRPLTAPGYNTVPVYAGRHLLTPDRIFTLTQQTGAGAGAADRPGVQSDP